MKKKWMQWVVPMGITYGAGGLAALLTSGSMKAYESLRQPSFAPPGWLFPVAWSILYTLMGIAAALVLQSGAPGRREALFTYGAQLFVNFWWPVFFFCWELRLLSFFWLLILLALAILMTVQFRPISKAAAGLQIPYILWLCFAAVLNLTVYLLNRS